MKEDEIKEIKQCKVKINILLLGQYIGAPMPSPTIGDADRIWCTYNSQIIFHQFFSCSVGQYSTGAGGIGALEYWRNV